MYKPIRIAFIAKPNLRKALKAASKQSRIPVSEILRAGAELALNELKSSGKLPAKS